MHQSELEPFHNPKSVSDQTGLSSDLRNSIQTSVETTSKHGIAWDVFIYIVKVAGWRDGHKRTRSSDSSWQSESSLVVLRTKRNLLEVAVFWSEAGAVNPQQGGVLRHSAMQKSKSRTSSKKLCELFVGGAHFLQHHSHPAPLHPAPGRHHAACPGLLCRHRAGIEFRHCKRTIVPFLKMTKDWKIVRVGTSITIMFYFIVQSVVAPSWRDEIFGWAQMCFCFERTASRSTPGAWRRFIECKLKTSNYLLFVWFLFLL